MVGVEPGEEREFTPETTFARLRTAFDLLNSVPDLPDDDAQDGALLRALRMIDDDLRDLVADHPTWEYLRAQVDEPDRTLRAHLVSPASQTRLRAVAAAMQRAGWRPAGSALPALRRIVAGLNGHPSDGAAASDVSVRKLRPRVARTSAEMTRVYEAFRDRCETGTTSELIREEFRRYGLWVLGVLATTSMLLGLTAAPTAVDQFRQFRELVGWSQPLRQPAPPPPSDRPDAEGAADPAGGSPAPTTGPGTGPAPGGEAPSTTARREADPAEGEAASHNTGRRRPEHRPPPPTGTSRGGFSPRR